MKTILKSFILLLIVSVFASCKKEVMIEDADKMPILPPVESILMDFSNFKINFKKSGEAQATSAYESWTACALTVDQWSSIVYDNSSLPIALYKEALKQPGVFVSNSTWARSFSIFSNGVSYHCKMEATVDTKKYLSNWKMYVSKIAEDGSSYTDYLWLTGTSASDGSSAAWRLNKDPERGGGAYLDILWVKNSNHKYTFVDDTDAAKGNFIEYRKINDSGMDSQFIIHNANRSTNLLIQWHSKNRNGRVQSEHWYNHLLWQCWGENYLNLNCN